MTRHFPIPIALLARLAVDRRWQGSGVGRHLLLDALRRVIRASDELGAVISVATGELDGVAEIAGVLEAGSRPR
jgi:predicted N-acetyltransferase YhbS